MAMARGLPFWTNRGAAGSARNPGRPGRRFSMRGACRAVAFKFDFFSLCRWTLRAAAGHSGLPGHPELPLDIPSCCWTSRAVAGHSRLPLDFLGCRWTSRVLPDFPGYRRATDSWKRCRVAPITSEPPHSGRHRRALPAEGRSCYGSMAFLLSSIVGCVPSPFRRRRPRPFPQTGEYLPRTNAPCVRRSVRGSGRRQAEGQGRWPWGKRLLTGLLKAGERCMGLGTISSGPAPEGPFPWCLGGR